MYYKYDIERIFDLDINEVMRNVTFDINLTFYANAFVDETTLEMMRDQLIGGGLIVPVAQNPQDEDIYDAWDPTRKIPSGLKPKRRKKIQDQFILYDGPSQVTGRPIVVLATRLFTQSENRKTANMIQTYILNRDISPIEAVSTGEDVSICGDCRHAGRDPERLDELGLEAERYKVIQYDPSIGGDRVVSLRVDFVNKKHKKSYGIPKPGREPTWPQPPRRTCYVNVGAEVETAWKSFRQGKYQKLRRNEIARVLGSTPKMLRIGTYGDPVAAPVWVWEEALKTKKKMQATREGKIHGSTGYTALWRYDVAQPYKGFLEASVQSLRESEIARKMGWNPYRAGSFSEPPTALEIVCPETPTGAARAGLSELLTCDHCGLCSGAAPGKKSIVIPVHGTYKTKYELINPLEGDLDEDDYEGILEV